MAHADQRLRRRTLIKAAIGGTLGGAVFAMPRIEGLSIAPDYASAGSISGCNSSANTTNTKGNVGFNTTYHGCVYYCWGNTNFGCNGDSACNNSNKNITAGPFSVNMSVTGRAYPSNSRYSFNMNGIDSPFQHCQVAVVTNCNGSYTSNWNANGSFPLNVLGGNTLAMNCGATNQSINVTMTCTCD